MAGTTASPKPGAGSLGAALPGTRALARASTGNPYSTRRRPFAGQGDAASHLSSVDGPNAAILRAHRDTHPGRSTGRAGLATNLLGARRMSSPASLRSLVARNALLAAIPEDVLRRLQPAIDCLRIPRGQLLAMPGAQMRYAYFPLRGVVALLATTADGESVQVALVGPTGVVGHPTVLHDGVAPYQALAPVTLEVVRIRLHSLVADLRGQPAFHARVLAFAQQQTMAMTRAAVCHRFHTTLQRLSLWLLTAADGVHADTVDVTQDLLAQLLGTTRTGISEAATTLDEQGIIRQRRGRVRILQRAGLRARACECDDASTAVPLLRVR